MVGLMSRVTSELLSDLDGTAFEKLNAKNPLNWYRNAWKRNLALLEGYPDFLAGVLSVEGIEMGGAATVRKEWLRRRTTLRSIRQHGLEQFFLDPERIAFGHTEEGKARVIGEKSRKVTVGMAEDQPQKHVGQLVTYASMMRSNGDVPHYPILVGVVDQPNGQHKIEKLRGDLDERGVLVQDDPDSETGLIIAANPLTIHVTQIGPYSEEVGQEFGQRLIGLSPDSA